MFTRFLLYSFGLKTVFICKEQRGIGIGIEQETQREAGDRTVSFG
jgi:hypothetical protein